MGPHPRAALCSGGVGVVGGRVARPASGELPATQRRRFCSHADVLVRPPLEGSGRVHIHTECGGGSGERCVWSWCMDSLAALAVMPLEDTVDTADSRIELHRSQSGRISICEGKDEPLPPQVLNIGLWQTERWEGALAQLRAELRSRLSPAGAIPPSVMVLLILPWPVRKTGAG